MAGLFRSWTLPILALAGAARSLAQVEPIGFNPVANMGIDQKLGAQVPLDLHFRNENGTDVALRQYFGARPVVLMMVFYKCHQMCAVELDAMLQTITKLKSKTIGKDYDVLCLSIDPTEGPKDAAEKRDAIAQICKTSGLPPVEPGWNFLTGSLDSIDKLATSVGFRFGYDAPTHRVNHPAGIMFLSQKGVVAKYMYGATYPSLPFREDLALAQGNQVGDKAEVALLGCIIMDPKNHIRPIVETLVAIFGVLTVGVVGFSIVKMNRASYGDGPFGKGGPPSAS